MPDSRRSAPPGAFAAALVLLAAPPGAPDALAAQGDRTVDQGTFELRVAGRTVGTETFEIRESGRQVRAAGRVVADSAAEGIRPLEVLLEADADYVPEILRLRPTAGDVRSVTAVREDERLRVQVSSAAGDRWKEFMASPELVLAEPAIAHHWGLILRQQRDRLRDGGRVEVPAVVPSEARRTTLRLRREGPDRVDLPGADRDGVRYAAAVGGDREIVIWTGEEGRVLRVESPSREVVAVRNPAP